MRARSGDLRCSGHALTMAGPGGVAPQGGAGEGGLFSPDVRRRAAPVLFSVAQEGGGLLM